MFVWRFLRVTKALDVASRTAVYPAAVLGLAATRIKTFTGLIIPAEDPAIYDLLCQADT